MRIIHIMLSGVLGGLEQAFLDYNKALLLNKSVVLFPVVKYRAPIQKFMDYDYTKLIKIGCHNIFSILHLKFLIKKFNPDVIIAHGRRAVECSLGATKNRNIKIIAVSHGHKINCLDKVNAIFAITSYMKNYLLSLLSPSPKIFVMHNMIEIKKKYISHNFSNPIKIGVISRFVEKKGLDIFLYTIAKLKQQGHNIKAIIAGEGEKGYTRKIYTLYEKLNLKNEVSFIGWVINKEDFFNQIDIFCLPSHLEPFGIVLLEAMMYSKPIVATKTEGPLEVIKDMHNGILCEVNNPEDLAQKLITIMNSEKLAQKLTKNAYSDLVQNYSIEVLSKKLYQHIKEVADV